VLASVINLGCRLNQSEGDSLRRYLRNQGYELETRNQGTEESRNRADPSNPGVLDSLSPPLDLVIVNTCCVTREAERSSLNRIRRAAALLPKPHVIATGCLAELAPERLRAIPGVDEVFGIEAKNRLIGWLPSTPLSPGSRFAEAPVSTPEPLMPLPDRSRAFLKVQDGCPNSCAFCVVSTLRTRVWSKPARKVRQEAQSLLDQGFHELVLVGLNLGTYGADAGTSLAHLLDELSGLSGSFRLRLSSLEPDTITPELVGRIETLCRTGILCPHLHMPLQSGDNRILARMARRYTAGQYRDLLQRLTRVVPYLNTGTDVIVGFPGETAQTLQTTMALLETLPLGYLHVFTFSPRPGTRAARMKDGLDRNTRKHWVTRLRALGSARSLDYRTRFVGAVRPAVLLAHSSIAVTDNYLSVHCKDRNQGIRESRNQADPSNPGTLNSLSPQLVRVRIDRVDLNRTFGTLLAAGPNEKIPVSGPNVKSSCRA
jgi:threonylcarbamoyladenosine tRNA methylthiotransferase MtaB